MQIPFEVVFRGVWKNNKHLNVEFNALLSRVSGHSGWLSAEATVLSRPPR